MRQSISVIEKCHYGPQDRVLPHIQQRLDFFLFIQNFVLEVSMMPFEVLLSSCLIVVLGATGSFYTFYPYFCWWRAGIKSLLCVRD